MKAASTSWDEATDASWVSTQEASVGISCEGVFGRRLLELLSAGLATQRSCRLVALLGAGFVKRKSC